MWISLLDPSDMLPYVYELKGSNGPEYRIPNGSAKVRIHSAEFSRAPIRWIRLASANAIEERSTNFDEETLSCI